MRIKELYDDNEHMAGMNYNEKEFDLEEIPEAIMGWEIVGFQPLMVFGQCHAYTLELKKGSTHKCININPERVWENRIHMYECVPLNERF